MCKCRCTNCTVVHLSENNTFFHSASVYWWWHLAINSSPLFFISGVMYGFRASLWEFTPNYLLIRLKTVLELIDVLLSVKWHRISCRSSLVSILLSYLTKRPISIEFDDNIVYLCLGATQFSSNIPLCVSFSVYSKYLWPSNLRHCMDVEMTVKLPNDTDSSRQITNKFHDPNWRMQQKH